MSVSEAFPAAAVGRRKTVKQKLAAKRKARAEERRIPKVQEIEDLRDDVVSIVRDSRLTYAAIAAAGGPVAATIHAWQDRKTKRPQLGTMRGALRACGFDLFIMPNEFRAQYVRPSARRL